MLLFAAILKAVEWQTERFWFDAIGYAAHFDHLMAWRAGSFALGAALFALWLGVNAHLAWRNAARFTVPLAFFEAPTRGLIPLEDKLHLDRFRRGATIGVCALLSWLVGLGWAARYPLFLRAYYAQSTGQSDAASGFDLGFFLFKLPLWNWLSQFCLAAIVAALLLSALIYLYEDILGPGARVPQGESAATRHLALLWALLLIWKGCDCLLDVPLGFVSGGNIASRVFDPLDIRLSWTTSALFAFSTPFFALICALAIARRPRARTFLWGLGWMLAASLLPAVLPLAGGNWRESGEWQSAVSRHLHSTRRAWGLDDTTRARLQIEAKPVFLSPETPANDTSPLALWPAEAAREAFNRRLRQNDDTERVSRVWLERGANSLFYRGIAAPLAPQPTANWHERHFRAPSGQVLQLEAARTSDGAPLFEASMALPFLFGPETESGAATSIQLNARGRGFGFDSADTAFWVLAGSEGETRGVSLQNWAVRLVLAARFFEPELARAAPQNGEILLWHRGAAQRCREIAPFLYWPAEEARPIVVNDAPNSRRLLWLVPGLVWSNDYPDSAAPAAPGTAPSGANYGRQGAVGVVDGRSGQVWLFVLDEEEPFMALYRRAFPELFAPLSALSSQIRAQLRPSPLLLQAQALIWGRYHEPDAASWTSRENDFRPLFGSFPDSEATWRTLASQKSGDWQIMAYADAGGRAGSRGGVSPLTALLGADERDFAAQRGRVRFIEWKPPEAVQLPNLLAEPSPQFEGARVVGPPLPTLLSLAPRFDATGAARGLVAARGEVVNGEASTASEDGAAKLKIQLARAGSGFEAPPAPAPPERNDALQSAREAWRDLRAARQKGDWNGVARAEKQLQKALGSE